MDENQDSYPPPPVPVASPAPGTGAAPTLPEPASGHPAGPPKKNRTLIVVLIVLGLLMFCCLASVLGGVLIFRANIDNVWNSIGEESDTIDAGPRSVDPEWDAFDPEPFDSSVYQLLSARNEALLAEIHTALFPDYTIVEAVCEPGSIEKDSYWMDTVHVVASFNDDPAVRIAYPVWIQPEGLEGEAAEDPSLGEGEVLGFTNDGTAFIYYEDLLPDLMSGLADADAVALAQQAQKDFPGCYISYLEIDGDDGYLSVVKYNNYPEQTPLFGLTYMRVDGDWEYLSSERREG